jgi:allophanate hydrolase
MPDSPAAPELALADLRNSYQLGKRSVHEVMTAVLQNMSACPDTAVWTHRLSAAAVDAELKALLARPGAASLPLYGVPFGVKDNIDVAGEPTTAACPAFRYLAQISSPVVSRLTEAGAVVVGKTNLDQFATGLAGDRSPYGACRNPFDPAYISGGSSSGSAVAVAAGQVSFALGTDTAGSGRVPAGCTNIVGLKPTPGLLSTQGVVPACRSLDCLSIFALTVEDAQAVAEAALGMPLPECPVNETPTFAVPEEKDLDFGGDAEQAALFRQTIDRLEGLGWRPARIDFGALHAVGQLLYEGPWLAERVAALGDFLTAHGHDMVPVTREVIELGRSYSAVDAFRGLYRLEELRPVCQAVFERADVLVVPTIPCLPTLAEVQADSRGWSRRLGHYTNYVNLLRWCALAVPASFTKRGLPVGITLIGPTGADRRLCELGKQWQQAAGLPLGATGRPLPKSTPTTSAGRPAAGQVRVAVAGAHLRGQPLHPFLRKTGARFVKTAQTAPHYRFVALMDLDPPRPGLIRDDSRSGSAQVELYDLPLAGFGALVESVAPPLAIGTVELADGEMVKGFLCESFAAARARDITEFGGWIAFREHLARPREQRNRL